MSNDDTHREFLLSMLRSSSIRAKFIDVELTSIGVALKGNLISPVIAVKWIKDSQLLDFVGGVAAQLAEKIEIEK